MADGDTSKLCHPLFDSPLVTARKRLDEPSRRRAEGFVETVVDTLAGDLDEEMRKAGERELEVYFPASCSAERFRRRQYVERIFKAMLDAAGGSR